MTDKRITRSASQRTAGMDPLQFLDGDAVTAVFTMLGHKDLCCAACVSKAWRNLASCDDVWQKKLRARWPLFPVTVAASSARDMYRKLLPSAEMQHTHARDVVLMVEMLDASGGVLVQGAFPLHELETREVHADISRSHLGTTPSGWDKLEEHFVLTFPQLVDSNEYSRVIANFHSSTICLVRKRDGKVVRANAYSDAYGAPEVIYSEHCVFPGNTTSRKLLHNFSASKDPGVRLLEASIKLGLCSSKFRDYDYCGQFACTFGKKEVHYAWTHVEDENGDEKDDLELTESDGDGGPPTKYWRIKPKDANRDDEFTEFLSILSWE